MAHVVIGNHKTKLYQMASKKVKYKVFCRLDGISFNEVIECREMTISDGAYTFWVGEYGQDNMIIASYPIMNTIIEREFENE